MWWKTLLSGGAGVLAEACVFADARCSFNQNGVTGILCVDSQGLLIAGTLVVAASGFLSDYLLALTRFHRAAKGDLSASSAGHWSKTAQDHLIGAQPDSALLVDAPGQYVRRVLVRAACGGAVW